MERYEQDGLRINSDLQLLVDAITWYDPQWDLFMLIDWEAFDKLAV